MSQAVQGVKLQTHDGASVMDEVNNAVKVNLVASSVSSGGGTSQSDKSAFTEGSGSITPIGGVYNETAAGDPSEDQAAAARITAKRGLHVNLRNVSGTELGVLAAPVRVDPTGTTAQPVTDNSGSITVDAPTGTPVNVQIGDGTRQATVRDTGANDSLNVAITDASGNQITSFGGGTQYTEDVAAAADPVGTALILVREDARAGGLTSTDGDNVAARGNNKGELYVKHTDSIAVTNGGTFATQVDGAALASLQLIDDVVYAEDTASANADKGVMVLAKRGDTPANTSGTDGDYEPIQVSGGRVWGSTQAYGDIAHDGVDSGNPVKLGQRAIAFGSNPSAVAAADRTDWLSTRHGIPFVLGGHMNTVSLEAAYTGAQTDTAIVTISTGSKIVVTEVEAVCDNANTVNTSIRVGFGTANTPTTTGVVLTHPGIAPGSGITRGNGGGILGVGADNEDLRVTCSVPTGGSIRVLVSYFTIES